MKRFHISCLLLLSLYDNAQCQMYEGSWMAGLFNNINRMNSNLQENIMSMNQGIQSSIQQRVTQLRNDIIQNAATQGNSGQNGISVGFSGNSYVVNSVPGSSQSVISGYDSNGEPYNRQIEDRVVGNILYHTEKINNPSRGTTNEFRYTLDLTNPNAKPVMEENVGPVIQVN